MKLNPYLLPDGPVQIAFSGGRSSGYMLRQILDANGGIPDRAVVTFQNTGREMPQTLDFVQEVGERWNVNIVWLEYRAAKPLFEVVSHNSASRDGEPFAALIRKKQRVPNQFQKFCSPELKTLTSKRYLRSLGWKKWTNAVGFRADELHREPYIDNRAVTILPLRSAGVTKQDVARFWTAQPFDLLLPSVMGKTVGGNCDGCFLKSEAYLSGFARDMPKRSAWWEGQEADAGGNFSKRFSRAELRNYLDRQGDWVLSTEGALCQTDAGECTA